MYKIDVAKNTDMKQFYEKHESNKTANQKRFLTYTVHHNFWISSTTDQSPICFPKNYLIFSFDVFM